MEKKDWIESWYVATDLREGNQMGWKGTKHWRCAREWRWVVLRWAAEHENIKMSGKVAAFFGLCTHWINDNDYVLAPLCQWCLLIRDNYLTFVVAAHYNLTCSIYLFCTFCFFRCARFGTVFPLRVFFSRFARFFVNASAWRARDMHKVISAHKHIHSFEIWQSNKLCTKGCRYRYCRCCVHCCRNADKNKIKWKTKTNDSNV